MRTSLRRALAVAVLTVATGNVAGCFVVAETHCGNLDGDASCAEGFVCNRCVAINDGCVPPPVDDLNCRVFGGVSAEDGSSGTAAGSSDSGTASSSLGDSSSSGDAESTSSTTAEPPLACEGDDDCTEAGEICNTNTGECVDCYAGTTSTIGCDDPDTAGEFCLDNTCVECIDGAPCGGEGLCDMELHRCVPCTAHDQCDIGACQLVGDNEGECFPSDALVVHVDDESAPAGAEEPYFTTMQEAVEAVVGAGGVGVIWVHPRDAGGSTAYVGPDTIEAPVTIALRGLIEVPGLLPAIATIGGSAFDVDSSDAELYLADINVRSSEVGLRVVGATVHARRVGLVNNGLSGVRAFGSADVYLDQSQIVGNGASPGGALPVVNVYVAVQAQLTAENCVIGSLLEGVDALDHRSSSFVRLSHSTLIGGFGDGVAVVCDEALSVNVDASILLTRGDGSGVSCGDLALTRSATANGEFGSFAVGEPASEWFADTGSDFHLSPAGADIFADLIQWQPGDPLVDIDGDARPGVAGEPDFPGADVPSP